MNYDSPKVLPSEYTSEELVWQGLGIVAMILAVVALSDTDRAALELLERFSYYTNAILVCFTHSMTRLLIRLFCFVAVLLGGAS